MKLLWLSNFRFDERDSSCSGTWIEAMGKGLLSHPGVKVYNVTVGAGDECRRCDACGIRQWVVPFRWIRSNGEPSERLAKAVVSIVNEVKPDLVHVWGTERFWGLLTARRIIPGKALLEMQGMPSSMVPYMTGCLMPKEVRGCFGVKEFLIPARTITAVQRQYDQWRPFEVEIIRGHRHIDYQSEWIRNRLELYSSPGTNLYHTRMMVRKPFLEAQAWRRTIGEDPNRILSYCGFSPNKGAHVALRAVSLLRARYQGLKLVLPGLILPGIRRGGYVKWLLKEVERLGMKDVVEFPGQLTSLQLINEMHRSSLVLIPSMVESYSMTLAESMAVGCPIVASYAGAMPEIARQNIDAIYFPIADVETAAGAMVRVLDDAEFALRLGQSARVRSIALHSESEGVDRQLEIYKEVLHGQEF